MKKTVLILTSTQGHLSLAQAIAQKLEGDYLPIIKAHKPKLMGPYIQFYQLFPSLFKLPYKLSEYELATVFVRSFSIRHFSTIIRSFFQEAKPDIVISTYYLFDDISSAACMRRHIPFYAFVPDPRTFHPITVAAGSTGTMLFDKQAVDRALQMKGVYPKNLYSTGWFVRQQFEEVRSLSRNAQRKLLGLPDNLTFLVCGGSEGTSMILKVLPALLTSTKPLTVAIVCGNNKQLLRAVHQFVRLYKLMAKKSKVTILPLGFVNNLHNYARAADLVIGKAGPNLIFESVATLTPFLAITHIAGQETGNLDLITDSKLGLVQEQPLRIISLLRTIIRHPSILKKFEEPIAQMAAYNRQAGEKLKALLQK